MAVVAVFVFFLLRFAPGDPAAIIAGDDATAEQIAAVRGKLGLDRPVLEQFVVWLGGLLHGDFGISIFSNLPVDPADRPAHRADAVADAATLFVAVSLAVRSACSRPGKRASWIDRLVMVVRVLGFSMPVFVVGYMLIYLFAIKLGWLPVQGYAPIAEGFGPWVESLILPSIALGLTYMALIARITRASMLEVLAAGLHPHRERQGPGDRPVLLQHALKNAGVPIVTVIGIGVALLICGVVITETVFNIPGLGRLIVDAISKRDYPIIQGVILVFSGVYVLVNLIVDITYTFLDPRIRY